MKRQRDLRDGNGKRDLRDLTLSRQVLSGEDDQDCGAKRANKIADIHDAPRAQHLADGNLSRSERHDHERVPGKKLRTSEYDEDEAQ